jgi:tetratricopeptide (TPR) repeat protein
MMHICEQASSPQAIEWAMKTANLSHGEPDTLYKLATLGLHFGETGIAQDALNRLPAPARGTAAALSIEAVMAIAAREPEKAESLFERAARLEPSNLNWRIDLLKLRLQFPVLAHIGSARQELEQISRNGDSIVRSDALHALLGDARTQSMPQRALALARELTSIPGAPVEDELAFIDELQANADRSFWIELRKLEQMTQDSGNPWLIKQVMSWANSRHLYQESLNWAVRLPGSLADQVPVSMAQCDALMGIGDWLKVRKKVSGTDWGWMNYFRLALYARAEQALGESGLQERWESAIVATGGDWGALITLARLAQSWGWRQQAEETLWLIARQPEGQRSALQALYAQYDGLYKVAKRYWEVYPEDPIAANNVASLGLLLGQDTDRAIKLAEKAYAAKPTTSEIAATYAFAMLRQDQPEKAVQALEKLPQTAISDPSIGLYYGLALVASGRREAAKSYLESALRSGRLFPAEQALAHDALGAP